MPVHPACPPTVQSPKHASPTGMVMPVHPACPPAVQSMPPRPAWSCRFTRHALRQSKACRPDRHDYASSPGMPSGSPKHAAPTSMVMQVHPACPPAVQSMPSRPAWSCHFTRHALPKSSGTASEERIAQNTHSRKFVYMRITPCASKPARMKLCRSALLADPFPRPSALRRRSRQPQKN